MNFISISTIFMVIFLLLISSLLMFLLGINYRKKISESKIGSAEEEARRILNEAMQKSESSTKQAMIDVKNEIVKLRSETDLELKERRLEIKKQEQKLNHKEELLEKNISFLEKKEDLITSKLQQAEEKIKEVEDIKTKELQTLEKISGLSVAQAKKYILSSLDQNLKHEKVLKINEFQQNLKEESETIARNIITQAIQRYSSDQVSETTVSVVVLPTDDMKGRIIGREGRNIRAIENLTGVDLIIDDTPEAIMISCTDPIRREVARLTLEKLITDGRIHPGKIEEIFDKASKEIDREIKRAGESAVFDLGLNGLAPQLIKIIGRLKYRFSYGQNVLIHSMEVANFAGIMAAELGADIVSAKRAGLLHDIGKAMNHEMEGSHIDIGVDIATKYKENEIIINAIASHHGNVEPQTIIAILVQAADAISAARPGARKENLENFIKRLEKLENIANSFEGVKKSYAIQAGREIRIIVDPEAVSDDDIILMAHNIVKKIEKELNYPGQIKVHIIRENRAIEYTK